ncbi:MAG: hypothetical protein LCH78_18030 [Proteobacteria bacterium]|nr:hypothetical protein [Pseudomonadota bacterium]
MSVTGFIKRMVDAGFSLDDALLASEMFEAEVNDMLPKRTAGAVRQARYQERKRQKASENDANDVSDVSDYPLNKEVSPTPPSRNYTPKGVNITTHARKADREPEGFEAFWSVYPRRVGKDAARKAFAKASRRTSLADLIAAVRRDAESQWRDRPPDMIPHPSTWLNQARWEDEPPPESNITPLRSTHERRNENPGLERSSSNLERAFAGAEIASRLRAEQSSGGF